jgi:hypothetical protein
MIFIEEKMWCFASKGFVSETLLLLMPSFTMVEMLETKS